MLLKFKYRKLDDYIEMVKGTDDKLEEVAIVKKAEEIFGCVSREVQEYIAEKLDISDARVRGIMKYNSISETPKGRYHISVCMGTTCMSKGAHDILEAFEEELKIKKGEMTEDKKFSLASTGCIKYCVMAPIVNINGRIYNNVAVSDVKDIIKNY